MVKLVRARPEHIRAIVPCVSDEMRLELAELHPNMTIEEGLAFSLSVSKQAWTALAERPTSNGAKRVPIAMFGIAPLRDTEHAVMVWCVPTVHVRHHGLSVARISRRLAWSLCKSFHELTNVIDTRNSVDLKWLTWLGAELGDKKGPYQAFKLKEDVVGKLRI